MSFELEEIIDTICVKMSERFFKWLSTEKPFSRRDFLRTPVEATATLGIAYGAAEAYKVFTPEKRGFVREDIDEDTHLRLLKYRPLTIAHNGADDFEMLSDAMNAQVDYIEADVRQFVGRLVVSHSEDSLALAWNEGRRFFGFPGTIPYFGELVQEVKPNSQKLFLEIKEDSAGIASMVLNEVYRNGLESRVSFFAKNWQTLDRFYKETGRRNNLFYTVGNYEEMELFLDQQGKTRREGVSLNVDLAQVENIARIRNTGARVLVAVVKDSKQALEILPSGIYGIISDNLDLLSIWRGNTPQRFWVQNEIIADQFS